MSLLHHEVVEDVQGIRSMRLLVVSRTENKELASEVRCFAPLATRNEVQGRAQVNGRLCAA